MNLSHQSEPVGLSNSLSPGNSQEGIACPLPWPPLALCQVHRVPMWIMSPVPRLPALPHLSEHFYPVSLNNLGKMRLFQLPWLGLSKLASLGTSADRQNSHSTYIFLLNKHTGSPSPRAIGSYKQASGWHCGGEHNPWCLFARMPLCWRRVKVTEAPVHLPWPGSDGNEILLLRNAYHLLPSFLMSP